MTIPERIVIVGAGIGGLSAGLCLKRAGFEVQLIERFAEVREVGAGILLTPNASNVLYNRLGLSVELDAVSAPMTRAAIGTWRGTTVFEQSVDANEFQAPFRMIHRARLQQVLYDALGADKVLLSSPVDRFELLDGGVAAVLSDNRRIPGTALIGADGIHSAIRQQLVDDQHTPLRYHGYTCWRGITEPFEHPDFRPGTLQELQGRGMRVGISYIDEQRVYWWATVNAARGEQDDPSTLHEKLRTIYAEFPDYVLAAMEATPATQILRNDIHDRAPLPRWSSQRVTLLGDAAHPMAPNLGQGACSAIEDADMVANCLNQLGNFAAAFQRYEQLRRPRTDRLQKLSQRFGDVGQWHNPIAVKLRKWSMALFSPLVVGKQQRWLWDYDAADVFEQSAS